MRNVMDMDDRAGGRVAAGRWNGRMMAGVSIAMLVALGGCGGGAGGSASAPLAVVTAPAPTASATPTVATSQVVSVTPVATATPAAAATPEPVPAPTPTPTPAATTTASTAAVVVSEGDSISAIWAGAHTGLYAAAHPGVEFHGKAVGGGRISDPLGGNGLVQRLATDLAIRPKVVTILIGANDLGDGNYDTPQLWLDALWTYVAKIKATGAKVAVGTVLPMCLPQYADYNQRHKDRRPIVNAAIRAAVGSKIDAVYDLAADPVMGPDAAACDLALFKDGLHPTEGAEGGQGRIAAIYGRVVDALLAK